MKTLRLLPLAAAWALFTLFVAFETEGQGIDAASVDCSWSEGFSVAGLDGDVTAIAARTTPAGVEIFAGGRFLSVDGRPAHHVARWTDAGWSVLAGPDGVGLEDFGFDGTVSDLLFWDDGSGHDLYAAGDFETAGGRTVHHVARWTGSEWTALGHSPGFGADDASVSSLVVFDDGGGSTLYAAGDLGELGRVARWTGSIWEPVRGDGSVTPSGAVRLAVGDDGSGPRLFALQGNGSVLGFDGQAWQVLAPAPEVIENRVTDLAIWDDGDGAEIYVSGGAVTSETATHAFVRQWDGSRWIDVLHGSALYPDQAEVRALLPATIDGQSRLFAAGRFRTAGASGPRLGNVAAWDGDDWHPMGSGDDAGSNRPVSSLATLASDAGTSLLVGGEFTEAGGRAVRRIASWDGSAWRAVGPVLGGGAGLDGAAYAFARWHDGSGEALFAGGDFLAAGDRQVHHLARWDGTAWQPLRGPNGTGTDGWVSALAVYDAGSGPALYAGGLFQNAGGVAASNVARWDGHAWSALGAGVTTETGPLPAWIQDLIVWDDGTGDALYAAGFFHRAGEVETYSVARWDGAGWSALGPSETLTAGAVYDLEVLDDGNGPALFAAGWFQGTSGDGEPIRHAARWDGQQWHAMDSSAATNFELGLKSLTVWDDGGGPTLFAAGAEGAVYRWDGTLWTSDGTPGLPRLSELTALTTWQGRLVAAVTDVRAVPETGHRLYVREASGSAESRWNELEAGRPSGRVDVLRAFDMADESSLWAGGSFARLGQVASSGLGELTCRPAEDLHLGADRFVAEVTWRDFEGNEGAGRVVPFQTDDSGLFYFFGEDNWELLVKVLDGCALNENFWVFSAATTNVEYTLTVTDTATGATKDYVNPLGTAAPAVTDTAAFATCEAGSDGAVGASPMPSPEGVGLRKTHSSTTTHLDDTRGLDDARDLDDTRAAAKIDCSPSATTMCLAQGRFAVEIDWRDFEGHTGPGQVVPDVPADGSGLFQFFGEKNWEVLVKVLDACDYNDRFWVFAAATTNVEYTLRVTDTATGESVRYTNPLGDAASAITDTDAFATCE